MLGTNGTGKTTALRNIVAAARQRVLIVTPDDVEWNDYPVNALSTTDDFLFAGVNRHVWEARRSLKRLEFYRKGLLVFDDCRYYFKDRTEDIVKNFLIRRRQREVDIIAVGHGFHQVPPLFFSFATDYILFKTTDNASYRKNLVANYELLETSQQYVNHVAKVEPHFSFHFSI